jgi:hypothetical protein
MIKRFLQFSYTAVKRYGAKHWVAFQGTISFNPNYVVSVSRAEARGLRTVGTDDTPYIVELSNGTKFLTWLHGDVPGDDLYTEIAEAANSYVDYTAAMTVTKNSINNLI